MKRKLTDEELKDLKQWIVDGIKQVDCARAFGVSRAYVTILAKELGVSYHQVKANSKE